MSMPRCGSPAGVLPITTLSLPSWLGTRATALQNNPLSSPNDGGPRRMAAFINPIPWRTQFVLTLILTVPLVPCLSFHTPPNNIQARQTKLLVQLGASNDAASTDEVNYARASQIRIQNGHDAATHHYRQLLLQNPRDTSAATFIAASEDSLRYLARVGWPYTQLDGSTMNQSIETDHGFKEDVAKLHGVLDQSRYHHSCIRKHIFNLPTGTSSEGADGNGDRSLEKYKNEYPMGPTYIRTLVAGQGMDLSTLFQSSTRTRESQDWLPSLQCLVALFLLACCVPRSMLIGSVIGGEDTLNLFLRLNLVFVSDTGWVVPLVHLFPLEIPNRELRPDGRKSFDDHGNGKCMVFMTDLHPNVLGMTSIPTVVEHGRSLTSDENEEGAVMYIGPDSLALVHHLHASMLSWTQRRHGMQSPHRLLDVCTGSGVQALAALGMLESLNFSVPELAVVVDVNERALRFARFNALLNGFEDKVFTITSDLLSESDTSCGFDRSIVEQFLGKLQNGMEVHQSCQHRRNAEQKFDLILANPPFIPVPPEFDRAASSLCDKNYSFRDSGTSQYGLFSSGGESGEDCLRAIVQMAPSLLRADGGLMVVVSEFMNPHKAEDDVLTTKIEEWWGSPLAASSGATGIVFTNEFAITSAVYAKRRAMTNHEGDISSWMNHLYRSGIEQVSPGLLFIQTRNSKSEHRGNGLELKHLLLPKTNFGSIWTPHNFAAVEFTQDMLLDLFQ